MQGLALLLSFVLTMPMTALAETRPDFGYGLDFGWQVLAFGGGLCARQRAISPAAARRLVAGMPAQHDDGPCTELDSGPPRSIAQVRQLMYGPVVPYVRVADNYAFSSDYGDGGGCGLFHFEPAADRWNVLGVCKGMMSSSVIERNHIPHKTVCELRPAIPDLKCP